MVSPTYSLIRVKDIKNNTIILDNDSLRAVLEVSGINFSLLSSEEQDAIVGSFKNFIDGLDFPIQILIASRIENINDYLKNLHLRLENEIDPLIKFQLEEYISFLEDYIQNNKVMKKIFYIVVPYDTVVINTGPLSKFKKIKTNYENESVKFEQLEIRVEYVVSSLLNLGLTTKRLTDIELIELLFEFYNPNIRWRQIPQKIIRKLAEIM